MSHVLTSVLTSLACVAAAVADDATSAAFRERVELQTDFLCEGRTDGSVQCWPGVVAVRPDGVRGAVDGVLLASECISILYEDGSSACFIEDGSTFILSSDLAVEVRNLYWHVKEATDAEEGLE